MRASHEAGPAEEAAVRTIEHGKHPVPALCPLALDESYPLLGGGPLESPDEARHLGIVMQSDELVDVRDVQGA